MVFPPFCFLASCESVYVNGHDFVAHEMSHPFFVELRMPMSNTPRWGVRNYDFSFPCRLARQASAGPAGYAVKKRGQPARRIAVLSNADLLSRFEPGGVPSDEGNSVPTCSGTVKY
jgi:hypothetical protein